MRRVVFTNGVFDVLHMGHIGLLEFCKTQGNYLLVAIDSDRRVKETKGHDRPIHSEDERKRMLEAIRHVDAVVIFDSLDDLRLLHRSLNPDVVVKGSDWSRETLEQDGISEQSEVVLYPRIEGYSTTATIERLRHSK